MQDTACWNFSDNAGTLQITQETNFWERLGCNTGTRAGGGPNSRGLAPLTCCNTKATRFVSIALYHLSYFEKIGMAIWTNRGASQEGNACKFCYGEAGVVGRRSNCMLSGAVIPQSEGFIKRKIQVESPMERSGYFLAGGRQKEVNSRLNQYNRSPQVVSFYSCIEWYGGIWKTPQPLDMKTQISSCTVAYATYKTMSSENEQGGEITSFSSRSVE